MTSWLVRSDNRGTMARPSTYTPERAEQVRGLVLHHFSEGRGIAHVARDLEVSRQTIYTWSKNDQELLDTLERGKDLRLAFWEEKAMNAAIDGTGNAPMFKFLMTNQLRDDYRERQEHQVEVLDVVTIDFTGYDGDEDGEG